MASSLSPTPELLITVAHSNDTPQTPTGRKRPCCTKCGKPMLGHKRGQCNAESTPIRVKDEEPDEPNAGNVTVQLAALNIDKGRSEEGSVAVEGTPTPARVVRRGRSSMGARKIPKAETLVSLTSDAKAVLDTLGKPGMMCRDVVIDESVARSKIENWLDSVPRSESPRRSRRKHSTGPPIEVPRDFDAMLDLPVKDNGSTKKGADKRAAKSHYRTSSAADRAEFFEQLALKSKKPMASVFTIEMKDIPALAEKATRLKIHARIIAPKYADGSTGDGWLVVGKEEESVKEVFAEVEKDVKSGYVGGYMTRLGDIATGAVIAWTILAYS